MNDFFLIGKIKSVASEDGFLDVLPFSDYVDRFFDLDSVFIDVFGGVRKFFIDDVFIDGKSVNIKFKNFDSREDVDFLAGRDILIPSADSLELDKDSYYIHDLIDSDVFRNGAFFGKVKDVLNMPANDVLVIEFADGDETLIPFINDYVKEVNAEDKKIFLVDGEEDFFDDAY